MGVNFSIKTAQYDAAYQQVRKDPWVLENVNKLPPESLVHHIAETYQMGMSEAEEIVKMIAREFAQPRMALSLREAVRENYTAHDITAWTKAAEDHIKAQTGGTGFESPEEARSHFDMLKENSAGHLNLSPGKFTEFWGKIYQALVAKGILAPDRGEELVGVTPQGSPLENQEATAAPKEQTLEDIVNEPNDPSIPSGESGHPEFEETWRNLPVITSDYILDEYEKAKKIRDPAKKEKKMQQIRELSKKMGMREALLRKYFAQVKNITIPPTHDNPTPRNVQVPEKDEVQAPDPNKVVVTPKTTEDKQKTTDQALVDDKQTRQEQLTNSLRAMEVMLVDFVRAMYGIELSHEYMGKLIESLIDKGSDLAAQQTADTVKQLASPFIGE